MRGYPLAAPLARAPSPASYAKPMPELPEVEHLRQTLRPLLIGRQVARATLHRRDVAVGPHDPPGGFARQRTRVRPSRLGREQLLEGERLSCVDRRGKFLAIVAQSGRALGVHLGMSGQVLWAARGRRLPTDHVHATWRLDDGSRLVFRDPRRFGGLWLADSRDRLAPWGTLGPDALDIDPEVLVGLLERVRRPIKAALLDQRLLAGVGNIYADESLHRAGIHPRTLACDLTPSEARLLGRSICAVLGAAVSAGGSTLRDYRSASGEPGGFQLDHRVYGRGGQPCLACGRVLEQALVAQRTTVWCTGCQPAHTRKPHSPQPHNLSTTSCG